jgi:hypothetical protein
LQEEIVFTKRLNTFILYNISIEFPPATQMIPNITSAIFQAVHRIDFLRPKELSKYSSSVLRDVCVDEKSICRRANVVDRIFMVSSIDADRITAQSTCSAPDTPHGYEFFCTAAVVMDLEEAEHVFHEITAKSKNAKTSSRT